MLRTKKIFFQIEKNIDAVISQDTVLGQDLWSLLLKQHPADIAEFINRLDAEIQMQLFKKLPAPISAHVFQDLSEKTKADLLINLKAEQVADLLKNVPIYELTDLFDYLSDEDLKKYLKFLQSSQRAQIISRLSLEPHAAGRIMNSDVVTLQKDFSVKKSISLLQRIGEKKELLQRIYITDNDGKLVGYINLDDLVLNNPNILLKNIMHKNELCINSHEDQEDVARQISHYDLSSAPVIDKQGHFLGVITEGDIVDIVEKEASEDVYKMSGISPAEYGYFETSVWTMILQRSPWLIGLLLLQSISSFIVSGYQNTIGKYFIFSMFLTMLIGTGGNAGNQSSAIVIRGLATGEITRKNGLKLLLKEFSISIFMALILVTFAFIRVFLVTNFLSAMTVSLALFLIIITSMVLGSLIPLLLERLNLDPAHSAAPFLATLMDILGVLIFCFIVSKVFG